jgi:type II restriction enzyme
LFQLKSQKSRLGDSITDGAYAAMMDAIRHDELPSFYFMQYEIVRSPSPPSPTGERARGEVAQIKSPRPDPLPAQSRGEGMLWRVRNLLLVPHFAFPPSAIIKRKPLSSTARRAGWVGCNFDLSRIPADARIQVVCAPTYEARSAAVPAAGSGGVPPRESTRSETLHEPAGADARATDSIIIPPETVRAQFHRVKPLKDISVTQRGWTLDVLNIVRRISEVGTAGSAVRAPSGRNVPAALPPVTSQRDVPTNTFTTADTYAFTRELEKLHPDNRHVKDKIRQQLQVLRDAGLLLHVERGVWRLPDPAAP